MKNLPTSAHACQICFFMMTHKNQYEQEILTFSAQNIAMMQKAEGLYWNLVRKIKLTGWLKEANQELKVPKQ